jgi:hypothetical protein
MVSAGAEKFLGKLVVGKYGTGGFNFVGRCLGYADHPTVTVKLPDGSQVHWAAHLCDVVPIDDNAVEALIHIGPTKPKAGLNSRLPSVSR